MDDRRELVFDRIEDVLPEVDRLLKGHSTTKGWTLGQILHHLATAVRLTLDSVSEPADSSEKARLERVYQVRRRRFFRADRFPEGADIPLPSMHPPADADAQVEADSLRNAIERLQTTAGPFPFHPLLGPMTKPEWLDFHRMHCEHHLGFARVSTTDR